MIEFSSVIDIVAPPPRVWSVLVDIAQEPRWMRAVKEVAFIGPVGYAAGAKMRRSGAFMGMRLEWTSDIVECTTDRRILFRHAGAVNGDSVWEIEPSGTGTHVRFWTKGPAPGILKWLPAFAAAGGRAGLRGDLARLKDLVEKSA